MCACQSWNNGLFGKNEKVLEESFLMDSRKFRSYCSEQSR
ncbi:hypothetical protein SMAC4_13475 [Sordaria macrospora]|nr:hypothetical protein SMAC4_13475 [Sordaria macrospora]